jgi:hypothetical protein
LTLLYANVREILREAGSAWLSDHVSELVAVDLAGAHTVRRLVLDGLVS